MASIHPYVHFNGNAEEAFTSMYKYHPMYYLRKTC